MGETVKEIVEKASNNPLIAFAVGAGTSTIVVATCWAIVKILQMLFA